MIQIITPPVRYAPVGHCIYCGDRESKLSEEHIIPFGIAGNSLVLPSASCEACATITGRIEQHCLRTLWGPFRAMSGMPTRNPKERPQTFPLKKRRFESAEDIELSLENYPITYAAVRFGPPGILATPPKDHTDSMFFALTTEGEHEKHIRGPGDAIQIAAINPVTYSRFLAKVAHAYAVATAGHDSFVPALPDYILRDPPSSSPYVGGDWEVPAAETAGLHHISSYRVLSNGSTYRVVKIRLFRFLATPVYRVVVGKLTN